MKNNDFQIQINELQDKFNLGRTKNISWKVDQLKQIKRMLQDNEDKFAQALRGGLGKSTLESYIMKINFLVLEVDNTYLSGSNSFEMGQEIRYGINLKDLNINIQFPDFELNLPHPVITRKNVLGYESFNLYRDGTVCL